MGLSAGYRACYSVRDLVYAATIFVCVNGRGALFGGAAGLLGIRLARREDDISLRHLRSEIAADRAAYMYIWRGHGISFSPFLAMCSGGMRTSWPSSPRPMSLRGSTMREGSPRGCGPRSGGAKRYREPLSVLFLDVDGLKGINDRHGHRAGSDALREIAA